MGIGLQPNAVWYACVGSLVGVFVALTAQNFSESINEKTGFINQPRLYRSEESTPKPLVSLSSRLGVEPLTVMTETLSRPERLQLTVGRGDTLLGLLSAHGIAPAEAHRAVTALQTIFDPRDIRVGQNIHVSVSTESDKTTLDAMRISVGPGLDVMVVSEKDSGFRSGELKAKTFAHTNAYSGTISTSLYEAAIDQGVPAQVLVEMIQLFSYDVDFQRDIRTNDRFELMFKQNVTEDGLLVSNDDIEFAAMTLRGQTFKIYAYEHADGQRDYYNEEGKGIRKALLRTPINGARLSSSFGKRKHPVLGYTKMHRGVDFAAPSGTPIYAAGDGIIEKRHRWGSFGNYIRIRHGDGFSTAYAHMKGFARGQSVGSRVRQGAVIGYVGTTGRSTGPHLHYEVHKNGGQVNPMKVRFPASKALDGIELAAFLEARQEIDHAWADLTSTQDVAQLESRAGSTRLE